MAQARRLAGLFVTAAVGIGLSACSLSSAPLTGTTSNSGTTSTAGPTGVSGPSGPFTSKANAICKSISGQIDGVGTPGDPSSATSSDLQAWARYLQQVIPLLTRGTSQLEGLIPPADVQANYTTLVRSDQLQLEDSQAAGQAASKGDLNAFRAATQKLGADGAPGDTAAKAIGLTDCASSG